MTTPTTIFGWVAEGFAFESRDDDNVAERFGFLVHAPDGTTLGEVRGDSPEAAVAAACELAGSRVGQGGRLTDTQ